MKIAPSIHSKSIGSGVAYGALAALIWGGWPVVTKLGVQQTLSPLDIVALRFAVAGIVLFPLVWRHGAGNLGWPRAFVLACGAGAPYVLVNVLGLSFAPAGHSGVIVPSCMLTFSMIGGWLFLRDRPDAARLTGYIIIFCGIFMVGWSGISKIAGDEWIGDLLFVASGFLWASYTVTSRLWAAEPFHATALVSVISMVLFVPAYLLFGTPGIVSAPLAEVALQATFQGLFAAILALLFYTRSLAILGAARGAVFAALVPAFALLIALPVLGEVPNGFEIAGMVTVTVGMFGALGFYRIR